jgi:hypothetical protein
MADMQDFDLEIQNERGSDPESFVATVTTAGSPITITPTSGRPIACAAIHVPSAGPNVGTNVVEEYVLYSTDGGVVYHQLKVNEFVGLPGNFTDIRIDSSIDGMKATIELRS